MPRSTRPALALVLACASGLLLATAAPAATVTVDVSDGGEKAQYPMFTTFTVTGTAGDDDLAVAVGPGVVTIADALAPLPATPGCTAVDEHHLRCIAAMLD